MFRKLIIFLLLITYSAFSQFVVKAYVTTDQPLDQDFCISKSLEKHEDKYKCRKNKNSLISTAEINPITTLIVLPDYIAHNPYHYKQTSMVAIKQVVHHTHAPPDIAAQTNYSTKFLIGPIILVI